jgi:hypothetical protein
MSYITQAGGGSKVSKPHFVPGLSIEGTGINSACA